MDAVVSEDSLRRTFRKTDAALLDQWQTGALRASYVPALEQPWIPDLDVTVKPIYGQHKGAQLGYNQYKPGRPSHAYHTVFLRTLRVALDVEVRPGKEHAAGYGLANLCADPERARETITSRPLLLPAAGRIIRGGGQTTLRLTSNHAQAAQAQDLLSGTFRDGRASAGQGVGGWRDARTKRTLTSRGPWGSKRNLRKIGSAVAFKSNMYETALSILTALLKESVRRSMHVVSATDWH